MVLVNTEFSLNQESSLHRQTQPCFFWFVFFSCSWLVILRSPLDKLAILIRQKMNYCLGQRRWEFQLLQLSFCLRQLDRKKQECSTVTCKYIGDESKFNKPQLRISSWDRHCCCETTILTCFLCSLALRHSRLMMMKHFSCEKIHRKQRKPLKRGSEQLAPQQHTTFCDSTCKIELIRITDRGKYFIDFI